jgi:hypothetical protein
MADRGRELNSHGEGHQFDGERRVPPRVQLSLEEIQVLRECNKESFWYRCVPLGVLFVGTTQILTNKGILRPNPKFGALFKNLGASLAAFVIGKMSYQGKCREKILKLENSALAESMRRGKRGFDVLQELAVAQNTDDSSAPEVSQSRAALYNDYDANRSVDRRELDVSRQPSVDNEFPPHFSKQDVRDQYKSDSRFSYDDLRRQNRTEYEKKLSSSYSSSQSPAQLAVERPAVQSATPGRNSDWEAPTEPSGKTRVKRNQYGDEIEA